MKKIIAFLFTGTVLGTVSHKLIQGGTNPMLAVLSAVAIVLALGFIQSKRTAHNYTTNDIQPEVWLPDLVKSLFMDNEFLMRSVNDSDYVNYKTVHKPQEAAGVAWVKNRVWGAAPSDATDRADTILSYNIDEWTSELMRVLNIDVLQLSYDKRRAVLDQMLKIGKETIANNMLYNWGASTSGNILRTSGFRNNDETGGIVTSNLNHVNDTATGSRNVFGLYDMKRAFTAASKWKLGKKGWVMVMTPNMYQELLDDMLASKYRSHTPDVDPKTGIVDKVMNFDIYTRDEVLTYTNAATPVRKAVGAAAATTDNDGVLFWSERAVCAAIGANKLMYNPDQAAYGGDVMRGFIYMGGSKERTSEIGVGAIVQGA